MNTDTSREKVIFGTTAEIVNIQPAYSTAYHGTREAMVKMVIQLKQPRSPGYLYPGGIGFFHPFLPENG